MKPVFKCEYCNFMGTEEEVMKHEDTCLDNYDKKSCLTCKHKGYINVYQYSCACGNEIPKGKIFEHCPKYERNPEDKHGSMSDLFGGLFGGAV